MLRVLGHLHALPHTLIGLLLLLTVYFPRKLRWHEGCLEVVPRWGLLPRGLHGGFTTAAQTHGSIIFYSGDYGPNRLRRHEQEHVLQCMRYGGILYPLLYGFFFLRNLIKGMSTLDAYWYIYFEVEARKAELR